MAERKETRTEPAREGWYVDLADDWRPGEPRYLLKKDGEGMSADFDLLPDAQWFADRLNATPEPAPAEATRLPWSVGTHRTAEGELRYCVAHRFDGRHLRTFVDDLTESQANAILNKLIALNTPTLTPEAVRVIEAAARYLANLGEPSRLSRHPYAAKQAAALNSLLDGKVT